MTCWFGQPRGWLEPEEEVGKARGRSGSSRLLSCLSFPHTCPPQQEADGIDSQVTRLSTRGHCAPQGTSGDVWSISVVILGRVVGEEHGEGAPAGSSRGSRDMVSTTGHPEGHQATGRRCWAEKPCSR